MSTDRSEILVDTAAITDPNRVGCSGLGPVDAMRCLLRKLRGLLFRCVRMLQDGYVRARLRIMGRDIAIGKGVRFLGVPFVFVNPGGRFEVGDGCVFRSKLEFNLAGIARPCSIWIGSMAEVRIGSASGLSGVAIYAMKSVSIGANVNIGANTMIWDTDFHELDPADRRKGPDPSRVHIRPVIIEDDAFVGANCIVLKGVRIGKEAVVGAGSVVSRSVPAGEVWAGNPARRIRGHWRDVHPSNAAIRENGGEP